MRDLPTWQKLLVFVAIMGLMAGVVLGAKLSFGDPIGASCDSGTTCRGIPVRCLETPEGSYCTRPCEQTDECPAGWICGPAVWVRADGSEDRPAMVCHR